MATASSTQKVPKLIDIGSNLGDPVFRGNYHGKQSHPDDFEAILARARTAGVGIQLLTGDCIEGAKEVLNLAAQHDGLFATVGCHPCRANEMEKFPGGIESYIDALDALIDSDKGPQRKALAVGECGLDYDRLFLSSKEAQLKAFAPQLALATKHDLPLFLHSRNCHDDFVSILKSHPSPIRGVVHSFTGTLDEALELIDMNLYIGINGCSLKTEDNIAVVRSIPLGSMMVESDCPWCEVKPSHASHRFLEDLPQELRDVYVTKMVKKEKFVPGKGVKGRNEPSSTGQVAWIVSRLKETSLEEVARATTANAIKLFGLTEDNGAGAEIEADNK